MDGDGGRTDQGPEIAPLKVIYQEGGLSRKDLTNILQGDGISTVSPLPPGPPEQLSGVAVVIIIAVCIPGLLGVFI